MRSLRATLSLFYIYIKIYARKTLSKLSLVRSQSYSARTLISKNNNIACLLVGQPRPQNDCLDTIKFVNSCKWLLYAGSKAEYAQLPQVIRDRTIHIDISPSELSDVSKITPRIIQFYRLQKLIRYIEGKSEIYSSCIILKVRLDLDLPYVSYVSKLSMSDTCLICNTDLVFCGTFNAFRKLNRIYDFSIANAPWNFKNAGKFDKRYAQMSDNSIRKAWVTYDRNWLEKLDQKLVLRKIGNPHHTWPAEAIFATYIFAHKIVARSSVFLTAKINK